jgi:hypothetical protein
VANRNFLIHQYDEIHREPTWLTLVRDLPEWKRSLETLFDASDAAWPKKRTATDGFAELLSPRFELGSLPGAHEPGSGSVHRAQARGRPARVGLPSVVETTKRGLALCPAKSSMLGHTGPKSS